MKLMQAVQSPAASSGIRPNLERVFAITLLIAGAACDGGSDSSGPTAKGRIAWTFNTGAEVYYSTPALGSDGTIYVGNGLHGPGALFALSRDGKQKWKLNIDPAVYSPTIGADGTIYVQDTTSTLHAVRPDGTEKWRFPLAAYWTLGQTSPAIASDGTVYIAGDGVYAIGEDGKQRWHFSDPADARAAIRTAPAIAADGSIIVVASRIAYQPEVWSLRPDGTRRWRTPLSDALYSFGSPAIGADGTIYVAAERQTNESGFLYAITTDGRILWKYTTDARRVIRSSPAVAADGTIYVGTKATDAQFDNEAQLLALAPDGTVKWRYTVKRIHTTPDDIYCAPTIGSDGTIYFGAETTLVYALDPAGNLLWQADGGNNWTSPALASDGTLYIGSNNGVVTAIRTDSHGLAAAPWPRYHHDNAGSGRAH